MASIHILDEQTIDQIAAGEVVERPVSVVKELVENALDAGATAVSVEIEGGGMDLIRITDNGRGIPAEQVPLAFFRHATSKINTAEDLFAVSTLGFRGEALSSIASVARVDLVTRTADSLSAWHYVIEGGEELLSEEVGAPPGTCFTVRDLFFNTPVRRGFMKSPATETSYIVTLMEHLAFSRPGVAMSVKAEGKMRLQTSGSYGLKDIIYSLLGRETASHLREVSAAGDGMEVKGFVGEPFVNRGNRNGELLFVNGRYVKSPLLMKAIEQAYHGLVMQHKFPVAVLQLQMEPELVDVNVHPQKTEVRFRDEKMVFNLIYRAVRDALFSRDLIPETEKIYAEAGPQTIPAKPQTIPAKPVETATDSLPSPGSGEDNSLPSPGNGEGDLKSTSLRESSDYRVEADRRLLEEILQAAPLPEEEKTSPPAPVQTSLFEERILEQSKEAGFRLIGQVFDTYWLLEYGPWFLLADQHAMHEKVLYERTLRSLKDKQATTQQLMPPLVMTLSASQQEVLIRFQDSFAALGFEMESLGGREIRLDGLPDNLFSLSGKELFLEMLDELAEERVTAPDMIDEKVALMSCKAAVKGNHTLSRAEAEALLKELLQLENPYTCPHGRPTMIRMSKTDLEKKFKRIV